MTPRSIRRSLARGAFVLALAGLAAGSGAVPASADAPWAQAEEVRAGLFEAQTDLLLDGGARAAERVEAAEGAITGRLERELATSSPGSLRDLRSAVAAASTAAASGNEVALAAARGRALAALRRRRVRQSPSRPPRAGEIERARGWLLIRDFRQATRFTRPGVDATTALNELEAGETTPERGRDQRAQGPARRLPGAADHLPRRRRPGFRTRLQARLRRERRNRGRLLADPRDRVRGAARP